MKDKDIKSKIHIASDKRKVGDLIYENEIITNGVLNQYVQHNQDLIQNGDPFIVTSMLYIDNTFIYFSGGNVAGATYTLETTDNVNFTKVFHVVPVDGITKIIKMKNRYCALRNDFLVFSEDGRSWTSDIQFNNTPVNGIIDITNYEDKLFVLLASVTNDKYAISLDNGNTFNTLTLANVSSMKFIYYKNILYRFTRYYSPNSIYLSTSNDFGQNFTIDTQLILSNQLSQLEANLTIDSHGKICVSGDIIYDTINETTILIDRSLLTETLNYVHYHNDSLFAIEYKVSIPNTLKLYILSNFKFEFVGQVTNSNINLMTSANNDLYLLCSVQQDVVYRINLTIILNQNILIENEKTLINIDVGTNLTNQNNISFFNCLILGKLNFYSVPAANDKISINQCTIINDVDFFNSGYTGIFEIRDNIIDGNITAIDLLTIESGNNRGSVNNITLQSVSSVDPLFIDSDYHLQYEVLGFPFDSLLVKSSKFHFRVDGVRRDLGCYNIDDSNLVQQFFDSLYLVKPNTITRKLLHNSRIDQGKSGVFDSYNNVQMFAEEYVLKWANIDPEDIAFFERLGRFSNHAVKLNLYPWDTLRIENIVTSQNVNIGDVVINIDLATVYYGDRIIIDNIEQPILYALDANNKKSVINCVRIVMQNPVTTAISTNVVLSRVYPSGTGEYQYDASNSSQGQIIDFNGEYKGSFTARFVRKYA